MALSRHSSESRPGRGPGAAVAFEPLEPRSLFSATAVAVPDAGTSTTTTDTTVDVAASTDVKTSNGKGANGYPHGKFGFW